MLRRLWVALIFAAVCSLPAAAQFNAPTAEELTLTSVPQAPGAPAIYLYREEIIDGRSGTFAHYGA